MPSGLKSTPGPDLQFGLKSPFRDNLFLISASLKQDHSFSSYTKAPTILQGLLPPPPNIFELINETLDGGTRQHAILRCTLRVVCPILFVQKWSLFFFPPVVFTFLDENYT